MFRRGTTPFMRLSTEQNWTEFNPVVIIKDDNVELLIEGDRLSIYDTYIQLKLTQEETLMFNGDYASIQVKGKRDKDGYVVATEVLTIEVLPILNEEVL